MYQIDSNNRVWSQEELARSHALAESNVAHYQRMELESAIRRQDDLACIRIWQRESFYPSLCVFICGVAIFFLSLILPLAMISISLLGSFATLGVLALLSCSFMWTFLARIDLEIGTIGRHAGDVPPWFAALMRLHALTYYVWYFLAFPFFIGGLHAMFVGAIFGVLALWIPCLMFVWCTPRLANLWLKVIGCRCPLELYSFWAYLG